MLMSRAYPAKFAKGAASILRVTAVILLASALAGCYTARSVEGDVPTDYRLRHPIALKDGIYGVEVLLGANRGGLTARQRADVVAFAQTWTRDATGGVLIDVPAGTTNERAAADSVHEIRSILTSVGIPSSGIHVRTYHPASAIRLAAIKLSYPKITAEAGPCGLWPADLGPGAGTQYWENQPYWNLGCAQQRNLAAMVDDPTDLVQPRGETPAYNARRSVVLDKYRQGQSTVTTYANPNAGKISDIGQ
jgi:pilus assembly protein CpaD